METHCEWQFGADDGLAVAYSRGRPISAAQFRADVEHCMATLGDAPDVLVNCEGRYGFSVALLAAWLSGKTAILPPNTSDQALRAIREQYPLAGECDTQWACTLPGPAPTQATTRWAVAVPGTHLGVRLYTSGSTGTPVVVAKSVANLVDEARTLARIIDWPRAPVIGSVAPQHMYGLTFTVMLPWLAGLPWVDESPRFEGDLADVLARTGARTLISIPAHYRALLASSVDLDPIHCVSAAAALDSATAGAWETRYGQAILEIYGSTETGVIAMRRQCHDPRWRAIAGVDLSVDGNLLKVRSPYVGRDWAQGFQTADRVALHADASFDLLGRADSIVKVAGKRVSLAAVERCLMTYPGVSDAVAVAIASPALVRDQLILAAVAHPAAERVEISDIRRHLVDRLESVAVPRRIVVVERIPRNANGKAPRADLMALFGNLETHDA